MSREDEVAAELEATSGVRLGSAIDRLLKVRGLEQGAVLADVDRLWDEVAGPDAAPHVRPRAVRGDELVLDVDHPAWATQVQLSAPELLGRLAASLGSRAPSRLSVHVVPPGRLTRPPSPG